MAEWLASVLSDITVVYLHTVLPDDLSAWLPPVTQNWKSFAESGSLLSQWDRRRAGDRREVVPDFIRLTATDPDDARPALYFAHILLPHEPWLYLPSGKRLALLTSKWVEVQVGATRSYAIWAVTA